MSTSREPPSSPTTGRKKPLVVTGKLSQLERLLLIGSTSSFIGAEALKMAVHEAKAGKDTRFYLEAQSLLKAAAPDEPEAERDHQWVETTHKANVAETQRLEAQLKGYKNNLIKESIRMGNEDLGKHYQAIGDLSKAFEAYSRMRQDISIPKHIIDVSKHLIEVGIEQKNYIAVTSNVQKIRGTSVGPDEDKAILPYLAAAEGLAQLFDSEYANAAHTFLGAPSGMGNSCNTILTPNDLAVYGGLCALASMERNEMQKLVLENSNFRTYLELEPHIRRAISFFVNSRYSACLGILESYKADYLLDIHLSKHVDELYYRIRSKSIVQYFIPFSCVTIESLNQQFAPAGKTIEKELVRMIERGELDARIDAVDKLLISPPKDTRATLQQEALKTAKQFEKEARQRLLHMNIVATDLEVKGVRGSDRRMGGMPGGMGGGVAVGDLFGGDLRS
ncbi:26S proteasome subunit RPN7 protein [Rutstroemia sp. NJR-2017a BBW]|nr:26S proteasome subunit RPN7 protein [Rutstroemia sp. NJR-2017a BBW]